MRLLIVAFLVALAFVAKGQADLDVQPQFTVLAQGTGTAPIDTLCLVLPDGTEYACMVADADRRARFVIGSSPPREVRAVARSATGTSAASPNRARFRAAADCDGDFSIDVHDIICVNTAIFNAP
jgi:hypothetical protein